MYTDNSMRSSVLMKLCLSLIHILKMAQILDSRKGEDILMIDVRESTILADWFVVATGRSTTHVRTLAEELEEKLAKEENLHKLRAEGAKEARWIVLDYGNVIVHIFHKDEREFYDIERLWETGDNSAVYSPSAEPTPQ